MKLSSFDDDIAAAERRIVRNKQAFDFALSDGLKQIKLSARNAVTSPFFLVGAAGVGFLLSRLFVSKAPPPAPESVPSSVAKKSLFGVIATAAFSIVQAQFGGPIGLARWVAIKILSASRRRQREPLVTPQASL